MLGKPFGGYGLDKDKFRLHQQSVDEVCGVSKVLLQQFAEILIYYDSKFNLFEDHCRSRIARGIAAHMAGSAHSIDYLNCYTTFPLNMNFAQENDVLRSDTKDNPDHSGRERSLQ